MIFDPTDDLTPLGQLRGPLQANYGLLVTPDGGDLIELPQLPPGLSGVRRKGRLTLTATGTLSGDIMEVRLGDNAVSQRDALRTVTKEADLIKPPNLKQTDQPFQYMYTFTATNYAKSGGNLLLVRPRVLGNASSDILEKKEPRKYPVEFDGPERDESTYEITLPAEYEVDDLPPPRMWIFPLEATTVRPK